jgi:hypothetical protein
MHNTRPYSPDRSFLAEKQCFLVAMTATDLRLIRRNTRSEHDRQNIRK